MKKSLFTTVFYVKKDKATLQPLIELEQLGYQHKTVNHQEFFINSNNGETTNRGFLE
jgi:hypothetical protein